MSMDIGKLIDMMIVLQMMKALQQSGGGTSMPSEVRIELPSDVIQALKEAEQALANALQKYDALYQEIEAYAESLQKLKNARYIEIRYYTPQVVQVGAVTAVAKPLKSEVVATAPVPSVSIASVTKQFSIAAPTNVMISFKTVQQQT